ATAVGLRKTEAADRVTGGHPRQPVSLLLIGAERMDRVHRERALDGDERTESRIAGLEFQLDQPVGHRPEVSDPLELHPEEPELAELLGELTRGELAPPVPVLDLRQDPVVHPLAGEVPDLPLL